jgi:hypothetical protein
MMVNTVNLEKGGTMRMAGKFATLAEVAEDLGVSYRVAWSAAHSGKIPAVQLFGKGTTWLVGPDYRDFVGKSQDGDDSTKGDCGDNR